MDYFIDLVIIGLSVGMVYALVALGISLIFSGLDIIHFAHGEIYMLGAFIGLVLFEKAHLPYVPTLLLATYGYVIKDGVIHIEGPADKMIYDDNVRLSYLGGTVANREAKL